MSTGSPGADQFERWILLAIVFAAIIAVALVAIHAFGIVVPAFVITIGWIVVIAFVAIVAIKLIRRMI